MKKMKTQYQSKQLIDLAKANEEKVLGMLGYDIIHGSVKCPCKIHGGDNDQAFSYDLNKHIWTCFTHHCEKEHGNDIIGLIRAELKCNFTECLEWIKQALLGEGGEINVSLPSQDTLGSVLYDDSSNTNMVIEEERLKSLKPNYDYMVSRGFKVDTLKRFGGGLYDTNNQAHHRFMLPIRNLQGQCIGLTGRSVYPQCPKCQCYHNPQLSCPTSYQRLHSKWIHYPRNFKKSLELYGIFEAKEAIYDSHECYIVEGPLDVLALYQAKSIKNAVAVLGTSISFDQCLLLAKCGCLTIHLCFDDDKGGNDAKETVYKTTQRFFNVDTVSFEGVSDPGDLVKQ
jgi:hypothetical protein